jgi:hypothetical protein
MLGLTIWKSPQAYHDLSERRDRSQEYHSDQMSLPEKQQLLNHTATVPISNNTFICPLSNQTDRHTTAGLEVLICRPDTTNIASVE